MKDRVKALEIALLQAQFELNKTFSGRINKFERELKQKK